MSSALDAFREQKEAVDQIHARVNDVARSLSALQAQVDAITRNADLREVLKEERHWLEHAELAIAEVRHLREQEMRRFWPGVWRRWTLALLFALAAATAAGAAYAWGARPYAPMSPLASSSPTPWRIAYSR